VQPVAAATGGGGNTMGLSGYQADVLFDFFVEHSVNGNQEARQRVLSILEERSKEKEKVKKDDDDNSNDVVDAKRQRVE
jgi:hypothetical protein